MRQNSAFAGHFDAVRPGRIVVVFTGVTDICWLRLLKPGFRHCYAVVECAGGWVLYDPASHQTGIDYVGSMPLGRLLSWIQGPDTTVVCCLRRRLPARLAPIRPYTCVEAIKRLVGVRAPWTLTPWQLFRYLTKPNKIKFTETEKILDILKKALYASSP